MFKELFVAPSVNSLFFTGFILLFIFISFVRNFNKIIRLPYYQKIMLLSAITVAIGIHGLIHLGVEVNYNINPYNWFNN